VPCVSRSAVSGKDLIERRSELAVAVADQEPEGAGAITEVYEQVAGLLGGPGPGRVRGDVQDVDGPGLDLHHEQDVKALEEDGIDVQEVGRQDPGGLAARNCREASDACVVWASGLRRPGSGGSCPRRCGGRGR